MSTSARAGAGRSSGSARPGFSFDVKLWQITKTGRKSRPYRLRWKVAGEVHGDTFASFALAESRESELRQAINRRGEPFEIESGLPESEVRAAAEEAARQAAEAEVAAVLDWFAFCRTYVLRRWRGSAAKTREGIADGLATATLGMLRPGEGAPDAETLRLAFRWAVVPAHKNAEPPEELREAYRWLLTGTRPLADLADAVVVEDMLHHLGHRLDGKPAAGDTHKRRRRAVNTAFEYAVVAGELPENPFARSRGKRVGSTDVVDPRTLPNPVQARQLLAAASYVGSWHRARGRRLVAFFAVMYYAAARPAEVVGLRLSDCYLPEEGWGTLTFHETRPVAGKLWTDSGERHDRRGLKAREATADRPVPIPPVLVAILRAHLAMFGTAKEGRVFGNERGDLVGSSTYWRVWREAREFALPPLQFHSLLVRRPYELRGACITRWLNAGVPVAEVARRVGNSPEVIHRRYQGCIDGHEQVANDKIARAMEEDGDTVA